MYPHVTLPSIQNYGCSCPTKAEDTSESLSEWTESIRRTLQNPRDTPTNSLQSTHKLKMLDIFDFIVEKGGNPEKIKESQRRRYAPEEAVDEVIALYEEHRKSMLKSPSNHYLTQLI
jgi:hypothetical protein